MKPASVVLTALLLDLGANVALAQTTPPPTPIARADLAVLLGWFNADKEDPTRQSYNDWYNSSLYGGIAAGWYWTDHHKTEIDFGATTRGDVYRSGPVIIGSQQTYTTSRLWFSTRKLTVGQQYQAYRNAWFHPHVAAGVDLTWEESREERAPTYVYDSVTRTSRVIAPAQNIGPTVDLIVRPYAAVGFKAYMTPRSFFRSDVRFTLKGGVDEFLWRAGFGLDF